MSDTKTRFAPVYPAVEHSECPFPMFDRLRAESPVHLVAETGDYLVTRHEDLHYVATHPEIFSSAPPDVPWSPGWSETMIAHDPPTHTPLRALVYRSFTPARIGTYEPMVRETVDGLIDHFVDHGEVEFVTAFANPLSLRVIVRLLGLPIEDASWIERLVGPFEAQGIRYHSAERQDVQMANGERLLDHMRDHVRRRIEDPGDDVMSEVVARHIEEAGTPNVDYLAAESLVLLAGGLQTTGHMVASAMLLLLQNPAHMERVSRDHSLLPRMIEETLRLESPAQWQPRYATREVEINGVPIPAGACVLMIFGAANRDPERFACPADFDIDRPDVAKHVAFGAGPHFCLGAPLARLEGRIAFERLLTRLKDVRLAAGKNDFAHYETVFFRAPRSLQLWFERA